MNGKSVEIDNTDAEGRLVLSGEYVFPVTPTNVLTIGVQMRYTTDQPSSSRRRLSTSPRLRGK